MDTITINGMKLPGLADLKPRALASFPEVIAASLAAPLDWKKLTEKKTWPLLDYKTTSFDFDSYFFGDRYAAAAVAAVAADAAIWPKNLNSPIDDIKAFAAIASRPLPTKVEKPKPPPDAVAISAGVSLRPLKYELDKVEVLKRGDVDSYWGLQRSESELRVHFITAHRVDGKELKLFYRQTLKDELLEKDPTYLPAMIRQTMRAAYMHEVDEMLYLEGERFTEPHPENVWNNGGPSLVRAREDQKQHREAIARIEGKQK